MMRQAAVPLARLWPLYRSPLGNVRSCT